MNSFEAIIGLWPSARELADEVGVNVATAQKWRQRGWIPAEFWQRLIQAARKRRLPITADLLVGVAAKVTRTKSVPITRKGEAECRAQLSATN